MGLGVAIAVGGGTADPDLANATLVEVTERMGETTTYRIRYDVDVSSGDFPLLTDSRVDAGSELAIIAPLSGTNNYLVKGPVTGQQIHLVHGSSGSYLEVQGADTSVKMDRESKAVIWADVTDSDAANTILSQNGYTAATDSTSAGHPETKHALIQRDTDLQFLRRLARRNGFLLWITWDSDGNETANFKKPPVGGSTTCDLILNLDNSNIEWLDVSWNVESPSSVDAAQVDLNDKSDIDGSVQQPPMSPLGSQGLQDIAPDTHLLHLVAPVDDAGDLTSRGDGALTDAGWFVRANCETTVDALKNIVRAHTLVNVRGLGSRHSGTYFVAGVKHTIDTTAYRMEIELVRNGWGS